MPCLKKPFVYTKSMDKRRLLEDWSWARIYRWAFRIGVRIPLELLPRIGTPMSEELLTLEEDDRRKDGFN